MEEIGMGIASKLAECLWDPISRGGRYLLCFNQFIGDVERAKDELQVKLEDVNRRKEEANRNTEEIMPSVKKWLNDVNAILEQVRKLLQELEGGGNKCFNVSLRYSLAKQMEDKAKQMKDLKVNSSFETFSQRIQLPGISTQCSSKEVMDFSSRKSTYKGLLEAIKDGKNKMVGLYGMGGSGKTTLAIEVGKEVDRLKFFDKVIKVVVSQPLNVRNLQEEIKGSLGLQLEEKTESTIAQRLLIRLRGVKILIILDDVWSYLNLQEIGIPLNENCRVMLTTRSREVCDFMPCERKFELPLLTNEEAWALLKMYANITITNDSFNKFDDVGREIVNECKGLPIAIVTVGRALRGKDVMEWKVALQRLQHSVPLDIDEISRGPFACLKLSYDNLPSLAKQLFLLCSMFPEDHNIHIEDLVRLAKGILKFEIYYPMEGARSEISVSVNRLLDSCLLMHTSQQACVKMHDLVRDVALWISKKDHQAILVDKSEVSRMLVENESLTKTKVISLWNLDSNFKLSNQLRSPTLEILLLHSENFVGDFGGIEALKVLALIRFSFQWQYFRRQNLIRWSMPQSMVTSLKNTHTLCFRGIILGDISFLCQLKRLEILDLRGSQFDELPHGIVDIKTLKLLDLFECEIEKSPSDVIARCKQLDELYFWDRKSTIQENFSLSGLKRYAIYDSTTVKRIQNLPFIEYIDDCMEALRALGVQGFEVSALNSSMKDLIHRANCLWLENCRWDHKDIDSMIMHLGFSNCAEKRFIVDNLHLDTNILQTGKVFSHLITLTVEEMNSLEQVFQSDNSSIICSLPMLQKLDIYSCPKLASIFTHAIVAILPKLKKLYINKCDSVKWLFSHSSDFYCPSLEELYIYDCPELESLFEEEVAHEDRPLHDTQDYAHGNRSERAFMSVTAKSFKHLRNHKHLTCFLSVKDVYIRESGRRKKGIFEVQVRGTENGEEYIEVQEESLKLNSELRDLDLRDLGELEYIWKGPTQCISLCRLEDVSLWGCPKLRNIFTLATVTSLPELKRLDVYDCLEWEGIFCEESLKHLSSSSNVCFPKLEYIRIWGCSKVKRLFSRYYLMPYHCPSLERLYISDCSGLESIIDEECALGDGLLHQRESLHDMQDYCDPCGNASVRAFMGVTAKSFTQLRNQKHLACFLRLKVVTISRGGNRKKGIFEVQVRGTENGEEYIEIQEEPLKLNSEWRELNLGDLGELAYIWKGPAQCISLRRLEDVTLWRCPKLRNIFTLAIVTSLPELKSLDVDKCLEWEGIFCEESLKHLSSSSSSNVCFPKLEYIRIKGCSKVKRLFSRCYLMPYHCPSLKCLSISRCSGLESIIDEECALGDGLLHQRESLHDMQDYCEESLKNLSSSGYTCFPKLEIIWISGCNKVKWLFSYSPASHCPSLERLDISSCYELEGVVKGCEGKIGNHPQKLFPKLKNLSLNDLPKLKEIYAGYEFNSLSGTIDIRGCPNIQDIPLLEYKPHQDQEGKLGSDDSALVALGPSDGLRRSSSEAGDVEAEAEKEA